MKYTIVTPHPHNLRDEIIKRVQDGEDKNESKIDTWIVQKATFKGNDGKTFEEEVLVHDTDAWKEVGGIRLIEDKDGNSQIHVRFFYWSNYPKDKRDNSQELYIDGRLTELLLVHFSDDIRSINLTEVNN